jgi:hypothetical protein
VSYGKHALDGKGGAMKLINGILRKQINPFRLSIMLSTFAGLSFFTNQLVADEVFVMFGIGQDFVERPHTIWSSAFQASRTGWDTGRFTSPFVHLLSNFGVWLTSYSSDVFRINLVTTYSFWRLILFVTTSLLFVKLVGLLLPETFSIELRKRIMGVAACSFPIFMIFNQSYSSGRMTIWSYSIIFILALTLTIAMAKIGRQSAKAEGKLRTVIFTFLAGLVGLLAGTSYELTQILAPVMLLAYISQRFLNETNVKMQSTFYFNLKRLFTPPAIVFSLCAVMPILIIRLSSISKCVTGCYQAADIKVGQFSFDALLARLQSTWTYFSANKAFESNMSWTNTGRYVAPSVIFALLVFMSLMKVLLSSPLPESCVTKVKKGYGITTLIWMSLIGMTMMLLIATGMASSRAVIEDSAGLLGRSNRDSLMMATGLALVLVAIVSCTLFLLQNKWVRFSSFLISSLAVSTLGFFMFAANLVTSDSTTKGRGAFIQAQFANSLMWPDFTEGSDKKRCELIQLKLSEFKEWEGHDRILVYGLNERMKSNYGIPYCSITAEELFKDYNS